MFKVSRLRNSFAFKATLVVVTAIYLLLSVGIIKSTHYCLGREASVALFTADADGCACDLSFEAEEDECCNDVHEVVRITDDQKVLGEYVIRIPQLYILDDLYTTQLIAQSAEINTTGVCSNEQIAPPPKVPIFKTNCSLVLYDHEG
jgi:hypothetical protein